MSACDTRNDGMYGTRTWAQRSDRSGGLVSTRDRSHGAVRRLKATLAATIALTALAACGSGGEEVETGGFDHPQVLTLTAYPVGATAQVHMSYVSEALRKNFDVSMRLVSSDTSLGRLSPVRDGKAELAAIGSAQFAAWTGQQEFATRDWGPQRLRIVAAPFLRAGSSLGTRTAEIETAYDLKGKRVPNIVNNPGVMKTISAYLACGDLTLDDVELVDVADTTAGYEAWGQGEVDVMITTGLNPANEQVIANGGEFDMVQLPHDDAECWERLSLVGGIFQPYKAPYVTGHPEYEDNPIEVATWSYPLVVTYDATPTETSYAASRLIVESYDSYANSSDAMRGWNVSEWVKGAPIPFSDGTIEYLKEIGEWSSENEEHQRARLELEETLVAEWNDLIDDEALSDDEISTMWPAKVTKILAEAEQSSGR